MASLSEMLSAYNEKAPEFNLKSRKSFRDRKDAYEALSKVGLAPSEPEPTTNEGNVETEIVDNDIGNVEEEDKAPTVKKSRPRKSKAKKAVKKKAAKGKKQTSSSGRLISGDEDDVLSEWQVLRHSKQHKALTALLKGGPVALTKLATIAGTSIAAISAVISGIKGKTQGKLMRGQPRPKYVLIKTKEEDDTYIELHKE